MKNSDLILMLIDKSTNAHGKLIGLNNNTRLETKLKIIKETVSNVLEINSYALFTKKLLSEKLKQNQLNNDQIDFLAHLFLAMADIHSQLNKFNTGFKNYNEALLILQWQTQQKELNLSKKKQLEINECITTLKLKMKNRNHNNHLFS